MGSSPPPALDGPNAPWPRTALGPCQTRRPHPPLARAELGARPASPRTTSREHAQDRGPRLCGTRRCSPGAAARDGAERALGGAASPGKGPAGAALRSARARRPGSRAKAGGGSAPRSTSLTHSSAAPAGPDTCRGQGERRGRRGRGVGAAPREARGKRRAPNFGAGTSSSSSSSSSRLGWAGVPRGRRRRLAARRGGSGRSTGLPGREPKFCRGAQPSPPPCAGEGAPPAAAAAAMPAPPGERRGGSR